MKQMTFSKSGRRRRGEGEDTDEEGRRRSKMLK
jgi:hypothetical protein